MAPQLVTPGPLTELDRSDVSDGLPSFARPDERLSALAFEALRGPWSPADGLAVSGQGAVRYV